MILLGPDLWGLIDRDLNGTVEDNNSRLDVLFNHISLNQERISLDDVDDILSANNLLYDAPDGYALFRLAQKDDRFNLGRSMLLGLKGMK